MPATELLDQLLPPDPPYDSPRYAAISTCLNCYNNVPHNDTLKELKKRCEVKSVLDLPDDELYFDIEFDG
jgi:hypothetical protein